MRVGVAILSLFCVLTPLTEFGHDHAELGGVLNGFSLSESGALAATIEKTGQAVDATYLSTTQLVSRERQVLLVNLTRIHSCKSSSNGGQSRCTSTRSSRPSSASYSRFATRSMCSLR